jgi:hypothetical protein
MVDILSFALLAVDKACPTFPCCYIDRETCLSQNLIFDTEIIILSVTSACGQGILVKVFNIPFNGKALKCSLLRNGTRIKRLFDHAVLLCNIYLNVEPYCVFILLLLYFY